MSRPEHLPDFAKPPLDEVVLGVQFSSIPGYSSVHANDIWKLFQPNYPKVAEQPILTPNFEAFGGGNPQPSLQLQMGPPPIGSRLWLLTDEENDLLQFQSDRFITNWRKQPRPQDYPRFEGIAESFEANLQKLNLYTLDRFQYSIDVNQAEVAYINIIRVDEFADAKNWFRLWDGGEIPLEALNINFDEVIKNEQDKPFARLKHHIQSVYSTDGSHRAFRLSLTFIGKPIGNDIASAMKFVSEGREKIVTRFGEITTDEAQSFWGRIS